MSDPDIARSFDGLIEVVVTVSNTGRIKFTKDYFLPGGALTQDIAAYHIGAKTLTFRAPPHVADVALGHVFFDNCAADCEARSNATVAIRELHGSRPQSTSAAVSLAVQCPSAHMGLKVASECVHGEEDAVTALGDAIATKAAAKADAVYDLQASVVFGYLFVGDVSAKNQAVRFNGTSADIAQMLRKLHYRGRAHWNSVRNGPDALSP